MPIREYKCSSCGSANEFLVGVGQEADKIECTSCGSPKLEMLFSAANFAVRGSAFAGACEACCGKGAPNAAPQCEANQLCPHT